MALERFTGTYNAARQQGTAQGGAASATGRQARSATQSKVEGFRSLIDQAARRHNIDTALLSAVVEVESAGNPRAISPVGAQGLAQLMPATARELGVEDPLDPAQNLDGAAKYLRQLLGRFQGDVAKALAAYNAGAGNVQKYGGIPPFAETQAYVPKVLSAYGAYSQQSAPAGSPAAAPSLVAAASDATGPGALAEGPASPSPFHVPWLLELATLRLQRPQPTRETSRIV